MDSLQEALDRLALTPLPARQGARVDQKQPSQILLTQASALPPPDQRRTDAVRYRPWVITKEPDESRPERDGRGNASLDPPDETSLTRANQPCRLLLLDAEITESLPQVVA